MADATGHLPTQKVSDIVSTFRPIRVCFPATAEEIKKTPLINEQRFRPEDSKTSVTSLDFDDTGELAIFSRTDDTIQIYNCKEGKHAKELKSQKYGVHLVRFTHHAQSILYASTKVDNAVRYLSTHDNSYLRYFKGHTEPVTCIALSPSSDDFISCSGDGTVRFWALNSPNAKGQLNIHSPYLAAYDPSASVIAVASPPTHTILLYDVRQYDRSPFSTFDLKEHEQRFNSAEAGRNWSKIEFSNDGKSLLVATTGPGHFVLDAFEGGLTHFCPRKSGGRSERRAPGEVSSKKAVGQGDVCFCPDGQYLIGSTGYDNGLMVWDIHKDPNRDKIVRTHAELPTPSTANGRAEVVGYNPRSNLICTADKDLMIWLPDPELAP